MKLRPILHHNLHPQILQRLRHLRLLLTARVAAHIPDDGNARPDRTQRPTLAVLDRHTLPRLLSDDLARMQVDGRIGLRGRFLERGRSAEDMLGGEELVLADLDDGGLDAAQGAAAHDRETVFLLAVQFLQLRGAVDAGLGVALQLGDDPVLFLADVRFQLVVGDAEVELCLQGDDHAAEVLADEIGEEFGAGVALFDVVFGEDFVGEIGAGFEGELFAQHERVVAVEEELCDLGISS